MTKNWLENRERRRRARAGASHAKTGFGYKLVAYCPECPRDQKPIAVGSRQVFARCSNAAHEPVVLR